MVIKLIKGCKISLVYQGSKLLKADVIKEVQHNVAVEQDDSVTGNLLSVLKHEACNFLKGTIENQHTYRYLQLASRDAVWIELTLLEVREKELGWGGSVRVWATQYDLHLEVL